MRPRFALLLAFAVLAPAKERKLTWDERVEIMRGLTAEFATAKVLVPRSKKPLPIEQDGTYDKAKWDEAAREFGPAGRVGDQVQITKVTIEDDNIKLEINGGLKSGRKWYERIEVGMGNSTTPVSSGGTPTAGTNLEVRFPKGVPPMQAADMKKLLAPILNFDKRSATEQYVDTLPPEIKQAIKEQRVIEGMEKETVLMVLGHPRTKQRETKDGIDLEDWVYGMPPGKITFVTFEGNKVTKVKEMYASLGGSVMEPPK